MPPRSRPATDDVSPIGRELPHNAEVERSILTVLLDGRHATAMHQASEALPHPLPFFHRDHRIVYLACLELDSQGHRVDALAVSELLSRYDFQLAIEKIKHWEVLLDREELDRLSPAALRGLVRREAEREAAGYEDSALAAIGGHVALGELAQGFAPAAGLERNLSLLRDYYHKRRFIGRLSTLTDKAYRTPDAFDRLIEDGSQTMLELGRLTTVSLVYGIAQTVDDTLDRIEQTRANPEEGVKTGIPELDKRLVALRPGGLYILAARPGAGKTSFALSVVSNIAGGGHPQGVLFFSLEVDRLDLVKKLLSAEARLDFRAIETGMLEPEQQEILFNASQNMKAWALDLMDVSDLTVNTLRSIVKRRMLESQGGLKLVVIDYLQLLSGSRPDMNEYEKVSEISRVLKILARELRVPVVALSQMSRDSEKGTGGTPREPRLSDLRGSGTIEQDADAVIFIHRVDQGEGSERRDMKIVIAKNRFGPIGSCPMHFFPATMRFEAAAELTHDPEEAEAQMSRTDRLQGQPGTDEDVF